MWHFCVYPGPLPHIGTSTITQGTLPAGECGIVALLNELRSNKKAESQHGAQVVLTWSGLWVRSLVPASFEPTLAPALSSLRRDHCRASLPLCTCVTVASVSSLHLPPESVKQEAVLGTRALCPCLILPLLTSPLPPPPSCPRTQC
jgi:hypothetical protein